MDETTSTSRIVQFDTKCEFSDVTSEKQHYNVSLRITVAKAIDVKLDVPEVLKWHAVTKFCVK